MGHRWRSKIERNEVRDRDNLTKLEALGWKTLEICECGLKDRRRLALQIGTFLDS
jgi:G:T-mismatch repair DNA endonuclease (very short patch repair protein)